MDRLGKRWKRNGLASVKKLNEKFLKLIEHFFPHNKGKKSATASNQELDPITHQFADVNTHNVEAKVEDHHHFIVDWVGKLRTMIKNAIDKQ
jgi:hypothetical protein